MSRIIDIIRRVVAQEVGALRSNALGVVTSVYPHAAEDDDNNYEVDVRLKYEGLELPRVPVNAGHPGFAAPLKQGDLVLVQFVDGDFNQPLATGYFYHDGNRPPLHGSDEFLFEHRVSDGTLNHLRFAADGTIYLQRDVTKPEDDTEAKAGLKITPNGDIEIRAGEKIVITLTQDDKLEINTNGQPLNIACGKLTVDGEMEVKKDLVVSGSGGGKTTISGNTITGG